VKNLTLLSIFSKSRMRSHLRWRNFFQKVQKTCIRSSIRSQNWKPHNPPNIYDIRPSGMLLFKIYVYILVQALQGYVTKLNPKWHKKWRNYIFLRPPEHLQGGKTAKFVNMQICLASGPSGERFEKVYFRTLELLGGSEEILLFWTLVTN
jgi:hypothetical protein